MAAEREEIVPGPHPLRSQDLAPDRRQAPLGPGRRRGVASGRLGVPGGERRAGERPAVHLAARVRREGRELHEGGGEHRRRQPRLERLAQLSHAPPLVAPDQVGHQPDPAGGVRAGHHRRVVHLGESVDRRLDLPRHDAEAAHLDLEVGPAEELELAARRPPCQVPRAVETTPRLCREGIGEEAGGGEVRTPEVSLRQAGAADVDLAGDADRHRLEGAVEEMGGEMGEGAADAAGAAGPAGDVRRPHLLPRRMHGDLRDAVHVDQSGLLLAVAGEPRGEARRLQRLAGEDHPAQGERGAGLGEAARRRLLRPLELQEGGRRLAEDGHSLARQQPVEALRRTALPVRNDDQPAAVQERPPDLEHRDVESVGVEAAPDVVGAEAEQRLGRREETVDAGVGDHHSLRPAGRARGVDDVGRQLAAGLQALRAVQAPVGAAADLLALGVEVDRGDAGRGRSQLAGRHQQHRAAVREGGGEALHRVGRIERHVGRLRLEHGEEGDDHLRRTLEQQGHAIPRAHPGRPEMAGQPVGAAVELGVGEALRPHGERRRVGSPRRLRLEAAVQQAATAGRRAGGGVPFDEELLALRGRQAAPPPGAGRDPPSPPAAEPPAGRRAGAGSARRTARCGSRCRAPAPLPSRRSSARDRTASPPSPAAGAPASSRGGRGLRPARSAPRTGPGRGGSRPGAVPDATPRPTGRREGPGGRRPRAWSAAPGPASRRTAGLPRAPPAAPGC